MRIPLFREAHSVFLRLGHFRCSALPEEGGCLFSGRQRGRLRSRSSVAKGLVTNGAKVAIVWSFFGRNNPNYQ